MEIAKKNISAIFAMAIIVLFFVSTIAVLPNAIAAKDYHKKTYPFIGATPNPIGVGQETLIHLGITDELQDYKDGYTGLTVTVTKPDNTTETLGPFKTDSTGGTGTIFTPTVAGTYYLQTNFPAQWYNWTMYGGANIYFEESKSEKLALNVTDTPLTNYPSTPLPNEYWTRPIDAQHYDWYQIAGSWVTAPGSVSWAGASGPDNLYVPYNQGPETPHILWRTPLMIGGVAGGDMGIMHYNLGGGGQSPWSSSTILSGVLIYNRYYAGSERQVVGVDIHTGKELWVKNNSAVTFGQEYKFVAANQYAAFSYWWEIKGGYDFMTGTSTEETWNAYDPLTGRWVYAMTNVPSGTTRYGPNGEIYRYVVNQTGGWVALWNSTAVVSSGGGGGWSPDGTTYNASTTMRYDYMAGGMVSTNIYSWNVTIPKGLPGSAQLIYNDDIMLGFYRGGTVLTRVTAGLTLDEPPFYAWAISLDPDDRGHLIWNKTYQVPPGNLTVVFGAGSAADRVWTIWCKETRSHTAYDLDTGEKLWGPSESQAYLDTYGIPAVAGNFAYGRLFSAAYAGIVYCYDARNGTLIWKYEASDPYNEILWSNNWPLKTCFITDGKIYFAHGEHSPNSPLPRGAPFFCLNATSPTAEVIWRIDGALRGAEWGGNGIIGDSIITEWNSYDNEIYGVGKGPTSTTVTTQGNGISVGNNLVIQGTVMDVSPGVKEDGIAMRFPNGVPAVADASQSDWMKYVYHQFSEPTNATGVEISVDAIDPNGNFVHLGTTRSDSNGFFSYVWQVPDVPGQYTIVASFAGSKAYYMSHAETAAFVTPTAATPIPTATPQASMAELYFLPLSIGTIVAVIIIGIILAALLIRKRP